MHNETPTFELTMNGKTKSFKSGYDMWVWANQNCKGRLEDNFDEKTGPFYCDWIEKHLAKNNKSNKSNQTNKNK